MNPILDDLLDLFPDTVTVEESLGEDKYGKALGYGPAKVYPARVAGQIKMVRGMDGQERVSSLQVLLGTNEKISVKARFTLPARYVPNQPKAIAVRESTDENGPHHNRVYFP